MQTSEQLADLRQLCQDNGLDMNNDLWQQNQSKKWVVGRFGIEKIQAKNNIQVSLSVEAASIDFAIVKATATRSVKSGSTVKKVSVESLSSASGQNCKSSYFAEIAEKRAKGRAILMLMGFSKYGVFGEDESDDFARAANHNTLSLADVTRPTLPAAPAPTPPASPQMAASAASGPSSAEDDGLPMDKLVVLSFLNEAETLEDLQAAWVGEAKGWHLDADVFAAKESRKAHLIANQSLPNAR